MPVFMWNGGTGNWDDAGDWSTGQAPVAGDDVLIGVSGSDVTLDTGDTVVSLTVGSNTVSAATLDISNSSGADTVTGDVTNYGTIGLHDSNGDTTTSLTVDGGFANSGALILDGGDYEGGSSLTITGTLTNTNTVQVGDTDQVLGAATSITLGGLVNGSGTSFKLFGSSSHKATLSDSGAFTNSGSFGQQENTTFTLTSGLTNSGTLDIDTNGGAGGSSLTSVGTFDNSGVVQVGSTSLAAATTLTIGELINASGASFTLDGSTSHTATMNISGSASNSGLVDIGSDAAVDVTEPSSIFTLLAGGTLEGTGTMTGVVNNTAGSIAGGSVNNSSPGALNITGSYQSSGPGTLVALLAGTGAGQVSAVNISGDVSLQGGVLEVKTVDGLSLSSGQIFNNVLTFTPGDLQGLFSELEVGSKPGNGTTVNLANNLTLGALYNVAAGNAILEVVETPLTTVDTWTDSTGNWGTLNNWSVRVPTFYSDVTIGSGGNVTLSQDATIDSLTMNSGGALDGSGSSLTVGGGVTIQSGASVTMTNLFIGGVFTDDGDATIGGTLDLLQSQTIGATGTLALAGGTIEGASLTVAAGSTLSGWGTVGDPLMNEGTISVSGGSLSFTGTGNNFGGVINGDDSVIIDGASTFSGLNIAGTVTVINDNVITASGSVTIGGNLTNNGTLNVDAGSGEGGSDLTIDGTLDNSGTVQIGNSKLSAATTLTLGNLINESGANLELFGSSHQAVTLDITGSASVAGTLYIGGEVDFVVPGGVFSLTGGVAVVEGTLDAPSIDIEGGTLEGTGTVKGAVGSTAGAIAGGTVGNSSPGTLTINGNYVTRSHQSKQGGMSTVIELLSGTGAGQVGTIAVTGVVNLQGGTLQVDAVDGFTLSSGQVFNNIMTFTPGDLQGSFSELEVGNQTGTGTSINLGNGLTLGVLYNVAAGNITLEVVSTPIATTDNWTGTTGNWTTPSDWSASTPTFYSDVTIGAHSVVTLSQDATIDSLTLNSGATLNGSGSSLTVGANVTVHSNAALTLTNLNIDGTFTDNGSVAISGDGTLDLLQGGTIGATGSLALGGGTIAGVSLTADSGSTLSGSGEVDVVFAGAGTVSATGGSWVFTGTGDSFSGVINGNGGVLIGGASTFSGLTIGGTVTVTNNSVITETGQVTLGDATSAAATFVNTVGNSYDIAADVGIGAGAAVGSLFENAGTLAKTAGTGTSAFAVDLTDTGSIGVTSGTLAFSGASDSFAGAISGAGTFSLAGGTDALNSGVALMVSSWTTSGSDAATLNENLTFAGTFSSGAGTTLTIASGDTLTLSGAPTFAGTINGAGTLALSGETIGFNSGTDIEIAHLVIGGGSSISVNGTASIASELSEVVGVTVAIAAASTLTLSASGSIIAGAISGAGTLAFSGGTDAFDTGATLSTADWMLSNGATASLSENLSYGGALISASGTVLAIGGYKLILSGSDSSISSTISGGGTLALTGGSQALNGGTALTISHWTTSGSEAATLDENLSYGGTFSVGAGTTLTIASSDTLTLSGTSTIAGAINGGGTLALSGGTDTFNAGASIASAIVSISNAAAVVIDAKVVNSGATSQANGTTISIGTGDSLSLSGFSSAISGTVSGAGTLALTGGSQALNSGAALTVSNWTTSGSDTVTVGENMTYGGKFSAASGTTLTISSGETLTLSGTSGFAGTSNGNGTLALSGGTDAFSTGATLSVADWTLSNGATVSLSENLSYGGALNSVSGTMLKIGGFKLTLSGSDSSISSAISGGGTLALTGGSQVLNSGAALTISHWTTSGSDAATVNENLTYAGTFSDGAGTTLTIASSDTLSLSGTSTFAGTINGAGALVLSGGTDTFNAGAGIASANVAISNSAAVTINSSVADSGTTSEASGTTISIGTGDTLSLSGSGSTIVGTTSGGGTLALTGGSQALNSGASLTVSNWTTSGSDAVTLDENVSYGGTFSAAAGTTLLLGTNTLTLDGVDSSIAGTVSGTGTLDLTGGSQAFDSGAVLSVSNWTTSNSDAATVDENLIYDGSFSAGSGTKLSIASDDTLTLSGASTFAGTINGAGTLALSGGTDGFGAGASVSVANIDLLSGTKASLNENLLYDGDIGIASGATLKLGGHTLTLKGSGSSISGVISGAGTLALAGGSQSLNSGAVLSVSNWTTSGSDAATVNENLTYGGTFSAGVATTLTIGSGDALTLTGTASFSGKANGAGTLAFSDGTDTFNTGADIASADTTISNSAILTVNANATVGGALSQESGTTLSIGSGDKLSLSGSGSTFAGTIAGLGTLAFTGGTQALNSGVSITVSDWTISGAAATTLNESFAYAGTYSQVMGTSLTVGTNDTLSLTGPANLGGYVTGGGTIALSNATLSGLVVGGTATLSDASIVDQTGQVTIGDASSNGATLSIAAGSRYDIQTDDGIAIGASANSVIDDNGLLIKTTATGTAKIAVAISDAGTIEAASGTLDLSQAISGSGTMTVDASATLELGSSAVSTLDMIFNAADATLALASPSSFAATVSGFAASDNIDLLKIAATSAVLEPGDKLLITDGLTTVATLQLTGSYTGYIFTAASDGHNGTDITATAPPSVVIPQSGPAAGSIALDANDQSFTATGRAANISILNGTFGDTFKFDLHFGDIVISGYAPGHDMLAFAHNVRQCRHDRRACHPGQPRRHRRHPRCRRHSHARRRDAPLVRSPCRRLALCLMESRGIGAASQAMANTGDVARNLVASAPPKSGIAFKALQVL